MGVAAAILLAAPVAAQQQGGTVTATDHVLNRATATYHVPGGGAAVTRDSAVVAITFTAGASLSPGTAATVAPGGTVVLPHVVTNIGDRADRFILSIALPAGWQGAVYADVDGDDAIGAGDSLISTIAIPAAATPLDTRDLAVRESARILVRVTAPADAADSSVADVVVTARSSLAPDAVSMAHNAVTVIGPRSLVSLTKIASITAAAHGDSVGFTLLARNDGDATSDSLVVADTLPATMRYVAGSLTLDGAVLPDTFVAVAPSGRDALRVPIGALLAGAGRALTFRAVLATGASRDSVVNIASVAEGGRAAGIASAAIAVTLADLALDKTIVGDTLVPLGGLVTYRLRFVNRSGSVTARDLVLIDSLPAELAFISGENAPSVAGQVVRWALPPLAPGDSATRDITVRVTRLPAAGDIVNHARLTAVNASAAAASAARTVVDRAAGAALSLAKAAGVLEAGLGEAVPYTLVLANRSTLPIAGIVVHDALPPGMTLAGRAVVGADSMQAAGRDLRIFVGGPLAPGESRTIRYNGVLTSARSRTITNEATASADDGRITSLVARATVRVRRGFEVENRTLVGKVWVDRNRNGHQDAGETGLAGVDGWSSDGATGATDAEGRFSFRDVLPGQHALRLDMLRVPAGLRIAEIGGDMVVVRADGWTLPAVDFRLVPDSSASPCTCPDTAPGRSAAAAPVAQQGQSAAAPVQGVVNQDVLLSGPGIAFIAPAAGSVVHAARIYVGVRGEANQRTRLYLGDSLVAEATLRPDGVHDFIGVPLAPGPHRLRAWMMNSWGRARWDSVLVHRSGPAAAFTLDPEAPVLHPGQPGERPIRFRVADRWGMPVAEGTQVTLEATGAVLEGQDTDQASLGLQRRVGADGWVSVTMRGGPVTGPAVVQLRSGTARGMATVRVLPLIRSMMVTGNAEVGVGAAAPAYGAVTARGAIDDRTALTVSYDSRRARDEDDTFARAVDPLGASQYPTLGDGSTQVSHGTGSGALSARIEREYDWLEAGDITPRSVGASARLFDYRRALTGVQGRAQLGGVTLQAFGSITSQQLQERQLAATGGSGPYALGADLRPGTERILVEVRARDNAARVIDRRELARTADYELDYRSGALLLRRPVASMDAAGNPVYIVAWAERASGGPSRFVGGGRAAAGLGRWTDAVLDSAAVGVSIIHDGSGGAGSTLVPAVTASALDVVGADLDLQRDGITLQLELLRSMHQDSTSHAARAALAWLSPGERFTAGAEWTRVAPGFAGGLDPRSASGYRELRVTAGTRLGTGSRVQLVHEQQYFEEYGIDRQNTLIRTEQRRGERSLAQEIGVVRDASTGGLAPGEATIGHARFELAPGDRSNLWVEATRLLESSGSRMQPDRIGGGAGYRLFGRTRLETTHFLNRAAEGSYSTSAVNVRTDALLGGSAWGGIERASAGRTSHAALLGIEQRHRFSHGWEVQSTYERRVGLGDAPLSDPARSLPFAQPERDRSTVALGLGFLPGGDRARLSVRGELQDGADQHGTRVGLAGDVPLGADAALIVRSDWSQYERTVGTIANSRQDRSILGYAFRPTQRNDVNILAKVEWRRSLNPLGTAALTDSMESRRMIATTDAVWAPMPRTELAARYAVRLADWRQAGIEAPATPVAHYAGIRGERMLTGRFGVRVDGRLLREQSSGVSTWSVAPSVTYRLTGELRIETGYRAGTLRDLDFGDSPSQLFATLGLHFTERSLLKPAAFWRDRITSDR